MPGGRLPARRGAEKARNSSWSASGPTYSRAGLWLAIAAVVFGLAASEAFATLPPKPQTWLFGPSPVWTKGTASPVFHPLSTPIDVRRVRDFTIFTEMSESSGRCQIRPAVRQSVDGQQWTASVALVDEYVTLDGRASASPPLRIDVVLSRPSPQWIQFGVEVSNTSGTGLQLCNAAIQVEPVRLPGSGAAGDE